MNKQMLIITFMYRNKQKFRRYLTEKEKNTSHLDLNLGEMNTSVFFFSGVKAKTDLMTQKRFLNTFPYLEKKCACACGWLVCMYVCIYIYLKILVIEGINKV